MMTHRVHFEATDLLKGNETALTGSRSPWASSQEQTYSSEGFKDVVSQGAIDEPCVNTIRTLSMDAVQQADCGQPGTPMALAPLVYVLYTRIMRHNPSNPDWID